MTLIRKFAYFALLAATVLSVASGAASAQESAHGRFKLAHDVLWGSAKVPAGEYEFTVLPNGVSPVLTLNKISGTRAGYMVLVRSTETSKHSDGSLLVLANTPEGSYVKALQLPDFGMTLDFNVPRAAEKQIARAGNSAMASGQ
jgi:hypothetical protein